MKGEVHAHIDPPERQISHQECYRTPLPEYRTGVKPHIEGDVKLCPHGKTMRWESSSSSYDRWLDLDPFGGPRAFREWRAARRAIRSQEGKLMPPPPPRVGGYPATRPVSSAPLRTVEDAMSEGQRIISVEKDRRTGAPERGKNALMVVLQDQNRLGETRNRTFTVELDPLPGEPETDFRARLLKAAMRKLETLPKDGRL